MGQKQTLVVDDDPDFGALLCEVLSALGHDAVQVLGAGEAEALLDGTDSIRLVFADLSLGTSDQTGFDLAERLALRNPDVRVVLMSGYGSLGDRPREHEGKVVLTKPISLETLRSILRDVFGDAT